MKVLAASSLCGKFIDDVLELGIHNKYKSVEWDLNFIPPTLSENRIEYIKSVINEKELHIRYHLPYSYVEIGHPDVSFRRYSLEVQKRYIDFISNIGGQYAVIHVGSTKNSDFDAAIDGLKEVSEYSHRKGIFLCVENLIYGLSTNPEFLLSSMEIENLFFCFDTGHADVATRQNRELFACYEACLEKCKHAHVYRTEVNFNHKPFKQVREIKSSIFIRMLKKIDCAWYTMELEDKKEQDEQIELLNQYVH